MPDSISLALRALGHELPAANAPVANFVSTVSVGSLLFVSGQIGFDGHRPAVCGRLGDELDLAQGRQAAHGAALSLLGQIAAVTGDRLSRVARVVRLGVFVASTPTFDAHPQVANGASDLLVEVFGERGRHTRTAVGVASLPLGAAVELDAVLEIRP